jgi:ribosomal protein L3
VAREKGKTLEYWRGSTGQMGRSQREVKKSTGADRLGQIGNSQREVKNTRILCADRLGQMGRGQREEKNTRVLAQTNLGRWDVGREKCSHKSFGAERIWADPLARG